jgi:hypothetical protein
VEKLVYLIGQRPGDDIAAFRSTLLGPVARDLLAADVRRLSINVADVGDIPDAIEVSNPDGLLSAAVSLWLDSLDARGPIEERLRDLGSQLAGYLVTESVPREYAARDWPDGERSPGVTLVAAFPKPDRIDDESFYRGWQESHTPLSLRLHPLTRYIRNAVARALTPGAPPFRAIVEERVASLEDLADPHRFYGSEADQQRAFDDLARFADPESLQGMLMSEYILLS